jgi:LysR family transcriptional regulator, transcription activator of glutamate synthase operon
VEIKQVQYFLSIVETGSFSAAADNLYISQSSLSKQIIALEKSLDVQLFDRSKRKVSLTEAGKVFEKHAQNFNELYKSMMIEIINSCHSSDRTIWNYNPYRQIQSRLP